jgi:hypothetical protein
VLGHLHDAVRPRIGLAVVAGAAAIVICKDPNRTLRRTAEERRDVCLEEAA